MFSMLGKIVVRFWPAILVVWITAVVVGWTLAPAWEKVTRSGEVGFLPKNAPSRQADKLFGEAFPLEYSAGNIALVFARADGELQDRDRSFIEKEITPGLGQIASVENTPINSIRTLAQEGVGALLVSPDKQATIVLLELKTSIQEAANIPLLRDIEGLLERLRQAKKIPDGLEFGVTGSATAGRDLDLEEAAGAQTIERWTIAIVIALLILLYRAPLVAIIPLLTVFVSVEVTVRFIGWLASTEIFLPSRELRIFVTVLTYGAGVDYCLFLIARYREELDEGAAPADALAHTVARVGGAITASAAVVIGGIGMLVFAKFGKIHEAGLVIPLALTVALAGTLTFAAALLRFAGRWAFWPQRVGEDASPATRKPVRWVGSVHRANVWDRIGPILVSRAGLVFVATNLILLPFVAMGIIHSHDQNYNPLSDLPSTTPSRMANQLVTKHFPTGYLGPVTMLVENPNVDFSDPQATLWIAQLTNRLQEQKDDLRIVDVRSLSAPLGHSAAAQEKWKSLHGAKNDLEADIRAQSLEFYVSQSKNFPGKVTRLDLTLADDPLNRSGIASLERIEKRITELLPPELRGSRIAFAGSTANLRDLSVIKQGDQELIQWLVSGIVLVLLLVVLRRVVVSVYLVLSVLMSYLATLGLTDLVFRSISDESFTGLDWKVPIFLFTILVAVGEDYNIFLLTRVKEEQDDFGPMDAIPHALSRTGQVISSCGFVMAGTFASLLSGSLQAMKELGFAMAVGILLDTLVVRPILVPTFLVLLQRLFSGRVGRFMALGKWESRDLQERVETQVDMAITRSEPVEHMAEPAEPVHHERPGR